MGIYFNWRERYKTKPSRTTLINKLKDDGFIYQVHAENHIPLGGTIVNNSEIIDMTINEWTGFFDSVDGAYILLFKDKMDAMAAKLKWS